MTTALTAEQRKKMFEWMADRSVDTDIDSQERTYRKQLLDGLGETHVREMAGKEGIVLTNEHLGVIECLRDYYLEFGQAEKGRDLEEMLDEIFAGHGGRKYLWLLFPNGPVTQGMRIAGLPVPPHTGDKGFGTVRQFCNGNTVLASVGWEEFSEFGKVQVEVDGTMGDVSTRLDEDFRDVWHFGVGAEYQYRPNLELTAGFTYDTSMSSSRTRPIVIPLGNMYRWAVGFKQKRREDLILGGGLSFIWEGNLPIEDSGGVSGKYKSVYARWHLSFVQYFSATSGL